MKLSIILATRKRPGLLYRTVQETLKHIRNEETKLVIAVDEDDEGTHSIRDKFDDPRIVWSVKPREESLGAKYNRVLTEAPADVYMVMVDYAPCVTDGFDDKIIEAAQVYPDGYAFIVNHLANLSFSQLNAMTHKVAERLGGVYPEHFPYWFVDHWFEDIARRLERRVFVDVFMDCSKRPGTMDKREPYFWGCVFDWMQFDREDLVRSIVESDDFEETRARKRAILRNAPLTGEWSLIINSMLKNDQASGPDESDARYMSLRNKAVAIVQERVEAQKKQEQSAA